MWPRDPIDALDLTLNNDVKPTVGEFKRMIILARTRHSSGNFVGTPGRLQASDCPCLQLQADISGSVAGDAIGWISLETERIAASFEHCDTCFSSNAEVAT
jgi:hypothetical protein